jgi:hypothetical protein
MSIEGGYQTNVKMAALFAVDVGNRIKETDITYMDNFTGK